jgi:3-oxoacyl-[acyl-carrier protein] reductase
LNTFSVPRLLAQKGVNVSIFARLDGLSAVVTGASTGIGRAIALELARGGANVVVHFARAQEAAYAVVQHIHAMGRQARALPQDFYDETGLPQFVERAWNEFGQIDLWVNNAGVDLLTGPAAQWDYSRKLAALWQVDVRATILLSKLAGARLQTQGQGAILNIGWDQADCGMEGDSGELFAAAKAAIMGFTRSLAVSLAPQVRVNCIAPGWIRTAWGQQAGPVWQERVLDETPLRRWGEPEDIARLARFLLSDDAAYLTGQVIYANGGAVR